jgi:hypothetical protein
MLSLEELAVLLSLDVDFGRLKSEVAVNANKLFLTQRFDNHVALGTINRLQDLGFIYKDQAGYLFLSKKGLAEIKNTRNNSMRLINKLIYG